MGDSTAIAANQVIPLPEPARRGLINAATDVAAATNQAVAAAAHLQAHRTCAARGKQTPLDMWEPLRNASSRSIIRTEEVDHDEPNPQPIAAECRGTADWARGDAIRPRLPWSC